jgi:hypothetical protein
LCCCALCVCVAIPARACMLDGGARARIQKKIRINNSVLIDCALNFGWLWRLTRDAVDLCGARASSPGLFAPRFSLNQVRKFSPESPFSSSARSHLLVLSRYCAKSPPHQGATSTKLITELTAWNIKTSAAAAAKRRRGSATTLPATRPITDKRAKLCAGCFRGRKARFIARSCAAATPTPRPQDAVCPVANYHPPGGQPTWIRRSHLQIPIYHIVTKLPDSPLNIKDNVLPISLKAKRSKIKAKDKASAAMIKNLVQNQRTVQLQLALSNWETAAHLSLGMAPLPLAGK